MGQNIGDIQRRNHRPVVSMLQAPLYTGSKSYGIALAVESMRRHMADAGWQIMAGLRNGGYPLWGHGLPPRDETQVPRILTVADPGVVVVQDKREWDVRSRNFRNKQARFHNIQTLEKRDDIFTLTILKDAHQRPKYHRESAVEMGTHAWIIYYHPRIVKHVAPYIRPEHCIRVYHTIDSSRIPPFLARRHRTCLFSGAISNAYPLRRRIRDNLDSLGKVRWQRHPGYGMKGNLTPRFLLTLSRYKTAICTSSRFGYALRKHIEATACGCVVITDLPETDCLPYIDGNLVRVDPKIEITDLKELVDRLCADYDADRQKHYADEASKYYDYRTAGLRLVADIENLRQTYKT